MNRQSSENHLTTIEEVTNYTKAGGGCTNCHEKIQGIIDRIYDGGEPEAPKEQKTKLSNIQKIRMIEETIDKEIRPSLKQDGGNIDLIDVIGNRVIVATRGACASVQGFATDLEGLRGI